MSPPRRNTNSDDANLNKDARTTAGSPSGYVSEQGGDSLPAVGDQDAPYVIAHGRASANGLTGLTSEPNGAAQRLAVDALGHLWIRDADVAGVWTKTFVPLAANGTVLIATGAARVEREILSIYVGAGWMQLHDVVAVVGATTATRISSPVPFITATLASPSYIDISFDDVGGLVFVDGIVIAISTTGATYTAAAGVGAEVTVFYAP